ncbi:MAG: glycosyltransferase family 39 protein [Anaerolineaceae bacterium]|nr:glycosyltransferase family 39 protein [Anaerolineaceae bacterium]
MSQSTASTNRIHWLALGLFVITILTRLPFQSQYLYHWDSVNMAFGIREYNVLAGAPQFPGYIVYVALGQVLNPVFGEPQATMLFISILSSGLSVVVLFYLGRAMFNTVTGIIAAVFLIASPLFWFYGEIALPHTLDMFTVLLAVYLFYQIMNGQTRWLWWATVYLALVGGFRQQTLLFLGPLLLFASYRLGIVRLIQMAVLGAVTTMIWFLPLMAYSGGFQTYMAGSSAYSASFFDTTSLLAGAGLFGLQRNLVKLIPYTLYGLSLAALPLLYWLVYLRKPMALLRSRKFWFIALWIAPAMAFYVVIHMGQQGLTFVFLPALLLLGAEGLRRLLDSRPLALRVAVGLFALIGAGIFVVGPTFPLGDNGPKLLTYNTLREHDALMRGQIEAVRENFQPENTVLLAGNWRFAEYYLPEYRYIQFTLGAKWEIDQGQASTVAFVGEPVTAESLGLAPGEDWQVAVFDQELDAFSDVPLQTAEAPSGYQMAYYTLAPDAAYFTNGQTFGEQPSGE